MDIKKLLDDAEKYLKEVEEAYHPKYVDADCDIEKILKLVDANHYLQEAHNYIMEHKEEVSKSMRERGEDLFHRITDAAVDIPSFCKCSLKKVD